jgi:AcrR family transcriptional regulator
MAKKAYHHGNLRAALVTAALKQVADKGLEGFSLRAVARRAGVTEAAPYRHFKDKDELLAAVAAECAERHGASMIAAVAEARAENELERFRATGIAYVTFAVENPEHFRVMNLPGISARVPKEQRELADAWIADSRRLLAAAQLRGEIARIDLDELLLSANAIVHGLAWMIVSGMLGEVNVDQARDLAIAVTGALGIGFVPRREGLPQDPRRAGATNRKSRGAARR